MKQGRLTKTLQFFALAKIIVIIAIGIGIIILAYAVYSFFAPVIDAFQDTVVVLEGVEGVANAALGIEKNPVNMIETMMDPSKPPKNFNQMLDSGQKIEKAFDKFADLFG